MEEDTFTAMPTETVAPYSKHMVNVIMGARTAAEETARHQASLLGSAPPPEQLEEALPARNDALPALPFALDREPLLHAFRHLPTEGGEFPTIERLVKQGLSTFRKIPPRLERPIAALHRLLQEYARWSGQKVHGNC